MNTERQRGVPSRAPICAQIARLRNFEGCAWLCTMNLTEVFLAVTHVA
jgi:hypothetical protein